MTTPVPSHVPKPDLFSKVGPLPAWGWGVVLVGGYLIYSRLLSPHANVAQAVDNPTATDPGSYTDAGGFPLDSGTGAGGSSASYDPSSSGYNYQDVLSNGYTGSTTGTGFATNQQWAVSVISNMPKMGFSASEVTTAVTLYLAGQPLTAGQANIISVAIGNFGPPPLPLPISAAPPVTAPKAPTPVPVPTRTPTPVPVPKPITTVAPKPVAPTAPAPVYYIIRPGDTLSGIAARHHTTVTRLMQLNPTIKNANLIYPGVRIRIS